MTPLLWSLAFAATPTVLVPRGSAWSALDTGVDPGPTWTSATFDDSAWLVGPAPLGFGVFEATTLDGGPVAARHPTTWFRATVDVPNPAATTGLTLELRRDDGAVVYLNGVEVHRSNLPAASTAATLATADVFGLAESAFEVAVVDPSLLVAGENVLAVEVHQSSATSDDLAFDFSLTSWSGEPSITRGPYLQNATPTSVVVRWRTDAPATPEVNADGRLFVGPAGVEHSVTVTGLDPATAYPYTVAASGGVPVGGDALHTFRTPPPPGDRGPVRIWAIGDSGTANADAEAVRDAYLARGEPADVWLMLGDNAYNSGTDTEYQLAVFNVYDALLPNTLLWSTLGNHDGYTATSADQRGPYYDIFTHPKAGEAGGEPSGTEAYYSFDYGNVHIVCLDSYGTDRSTNSAMWAWLNDDLASTSADWIIAFFHHPPYTRGSHNSDFEAQLVEMREEALPILESWGVDLVLSGHSHSYERSLLLDGHYGLSSTLDPLMIRDGGDGDPLGDGAYTKPSASGGTHEGAVYLVAGASGKTGGGSLDHPVMVESLNALGSLMIDVEGLSMTVRYLDHVGGVRDSFTIERGHTSVLEISAALPVREAEASALHAFAIDPQGDEVVSYAWDFGDGQVGAGADVLHLWPDDGLFDVTVTVTDAAGGTADRALPVEVINVAPVFVDLGAEAAFEGQPTRFWAAATDVAADTVTLTWDFGDGSGAALGEEVEHVYLRDGTYTATVTARDDDGGVSVSAFSVVVADLPPEQQTIYVSPAAEGQLTVLSAGDNPEIVSWSWDFFDGSPPRERQSTDYTWLDDGPMPVTLTVTDAEGDAAVTMIVVPVENLPPENLQIGAPAGGPEGAPLAFVATATDPGDDLLSMSWTFDGFVPQAFGPSVEHTFRDDGLQTVVLTVDDGDGGEIEQSFAVDIVNVAPQLSQLSGPSELFEGSVAAFTAVATDPADPVTITWDFGAGATAQGEQVEWIFLDDGPATVRVEADDGDGGVARATLQVLVRNAAPTLASAPPASAVAGQPYRYPAAAIDPGADPLTFTLDGPPGSTVGPGGLVTWAPARPEQQVSFALTASDGELSVTQRWAVDVAAAPAAPATTTTEVLQRRGCSCESAGSLGWLAALGAIAALRRRRATAARPHDRARP
jgi:PKD repeat protein